MNPLKAVKTIRIRRAKKIIQITMWTRIKNWIQNILPQKTEFEQNKVVFRTSELHLATIMKLKLEEEGVHVILINKMDTSYNNFGQIELYVHQNDVIRAKYIIDKPYE